MPWEVGAILAVLFGMSPAASGVGEDSPYETIEVYSILSSERAEEELPGLPGFRVYEQDGCLYAWHSASHTPQVTYAMPSKDDILPVFGRVYRFKSIPSQSGRVLGVLEKIPDDNLPEGITVQRDSIIVPMPRANKGHTIIRLSAQGIKLNRCYFELGDIREDDSGLSARLRERWQERSSRHVVQVGDVLTFGDFKFRVQNIVPRDEQKHIIGWVELARVVEERVKEERQ